MASSSSERKNMGALRCIMVLVLIGTLPAGTSKTAQDKEEKKPYLLCDSVACKEKAKLINEWGAKTPKPCDDFYLHACEGWIEKHKDKSSYDVYQMLRESYVRTLQGLLENIDAVDAAKDVVKKAALLYKACKDIPQDNKNLDALLGIMKESGLNSWPLTTKDDRFASAEDVIESTGISPILEHYVGKGSEDPTRNVLKVFVIRFMRPSQEALIKAVLRFVKSELTEEQVNTVTKEILDIESQLMQVIEPYMRMQPTKPHNTTVANLDKDFPNFRIRSWLNKEFLKAEYTLKDDDVIEVYYKDSYMKITEFLKAANPIPLYNFIGYQQVIAWGEHTSTSFPKLPPGPADRGEHCVGLVNTAMKEVVAHLYATKKGVSAAKTEVEYVVERLKHMYEKAIDAVEWMDEETKLRAKSKVKDMRPKIGYPGWLLSSTILQEHYKHLPDLKPDMPFVQMMHYAVESNNKIIIEKINQAYDQEMDWFFTLSAVTPFYNPGNNELVFPLGALQPPFYEREIPMSLNFGSAGVVIAHEMAHGLVGKGSNYGADGQLAPWWTQVTEDNFKVRADCFRHQYDSITDTQTSLKINGTRTLDENMADRAGLEIAVKAYKELVSHCKRRSAQLKGLEDQTPEKLFFTSYAMVWCSVADARTKITKINWMPHSPNEYRVNQPLKSLPEFAAAFQCPSGSAMSPTENENCMLW